MRQQYVPIAAALCLALSACGGDSTTSPDTALMSCKINGTDWKASAISKSGFDPEALVAGSYDRNGLTELLTLMIDTARAGRTIVMQSDSLDPFTPHASFSRADGSWKTRNGSGTVKITDVSGGRMKGTFSFTLYKNGSSGGDSLIVTEGTFNSLY